MQNFEPIFANDGYRPNVGIIISDGLGRVLFAKRLGQQAWQFPQGGIDEGESVEQALYRELYEETGLIRKQVRLVAHTKKWLHYDLPHRLLRNQRRAQGPGRKRVNFKGQKQVWFLLELTEDDSVVDLKAGPETPEFDSWRWVDTHHAIDNIVDFKRGVYQQALSELGQFLPTS